MDKAEIVQRIGSCWKNVRNHLFHKRKPAGIEADHWKSFFNIGWTRTQRRCVEKMPLIVQSNCTHIPEVLKRWQERDTKK
ncbi:hypothetical protein AHAS_Ahas12G0186400 [Arachis hypogaea]